MRKISFLILFISISFLSKSQDVYLNGVEWPGYVYTCFGTQINLTCSINGGTPPYTCQWLSDDGGDTLSTNLSYSLGPGQYLFRIIKSGVTVSEYDLLVFEDDQILVNDTPSTYGSGYNVSTYGGNDGAIAIAVQGGSSPYAYLWSSGQTTANINSLTAGTYIVTVTDDHGCFKKDTVVLTQPPGPLTISSITSTSYHGYNVSCKGCEDGVVNMTITGGAPPYKYSWSNGNMDEDIDTLKARQYKVLVTDNNGGTASSSITLTEPGALSVALSAQTYTVNGGTYNLSCVDCNNGSITATPSGGVPGYSYLWTTGQTTATISNLASGQYAVQVTDTNGAKTKEAIFLKAPDRNDWAMAGNASTDSTTQYLGTSDNKPLVIKTNNTERIHIQNNGKTIFQSPVEVSDIKITKPLKLDTLKINRILALDGDSVINFGEGSIHVYGNQNRIWGSGNSSNTFDGLGFGQSSWSQAPYGIAVGSYARVSTSGYNGNAFGTYVKADASSATILGTGKLSSQTYFTNSIANSVMIGAGSTVPAIFIEPPSSTSLSGNIGIGGITSPSARMHIRIDQNNTNGGIILDRNSSTTAHSEIKFWQQGSPKWRLGNDLGETGGDNFFFYNEALTKSILTISNVQGDGAVGINFDPASIGSSRNPDYKLYVDGSIAAREIKVTINSFPDYVFSNEYKLRTLDELKIFINENKHLPGLPSANDVKINNGIELGEMQTMLLEKIEEQTLYILELKKEIDDLKNRIK